jgi:hypothetical protein
MLVYEECRHEESTPQVKAMERAFKKSTEGQRLNKLIREKHVDGSRSRDPSLHSRGESSVRVDTALYTPAHQRDRRIGESNSDSRRKEYYEKRREEVSSRDHGRDYAKDRDRGGDSDKDKDRDRYKGAGRNQRGSGRDPTPDRRSHSRDKVEDHRKRAGESQDKKDGQRGIDQTTVSVLKLMMIIPVYAHSSMLRR